MGGVDDWECVKVSFLQYFSELERGIGKGHHWRKGHYLLLLSFLIYSLFDGVKEKENSTTSCPKLIRMNGLEYPNCRSLACAYFYVFSCMYNEY